MASQYNDNCYSADHEVAIDLTWMMYNFAALKSSFSGSVPPSYGNIAPGQLFMNTATGYSFQIRNQANSLWRAIPTFGIDGSGKMEELWIYSNAALEGWNVDSSYQDCCIAVYGGSYGAARQYSGSFVIPGHALSVGEIPSHYHTFASYYGIATYEAAGGAYEVYASQGMNTDYEGGNLPHTHGDISIGDAPFRPYAAVGVLVYPGLG